MGQDIRGRSDRSIDRAARVRGARAIAGLKQPELGALISTSAQTVKRMESGEKAVSLDELRLIADACGVPRWFMEGGFDARPEEMSEQDRLQEDIARLEQQLAHENARQHATMAALLHRLERLEHQAPDSGPTQQEINMLRAQEEDAAAGIRGTEAALNARRAAAETARRAEMQRDEDSGQSQPKRSSR